MLTELTWLIIIISCSRVISFNVQLMYCIFYKHESKPKRNTHPSKYSVDMISNNNNPPRPLPAPPPT